MRKDVARSAKAVQAIRRALPDADLLKVEHWAQRVGVSRTRAYNWCRDNRIEQLEIDGTIYISASVPRPERLKPGIKPDGPATLLTLERKALAARKLAQRKKKVQIRAKEGRKLTTGKQSV